ncbi:FISUMP domain-containing protein [Bacteroidota bacterium]
MKTKIFLSILTIVIIVSAFGQKATLELTFSAIDNTSYVQIDSIKVMNRTQGGDTMLYWPDTVLAMDYIVGSKELNRNYKRLQVFQNYPNPVNDQTTITFYVPEKDKVGIIITDILGRTVNRTEQILHKGYHSFMFIPGSGSLFFFTVQWRGNSSNIRILHTASNARQEGSLKYLEGKMVVEQQLKAIKGFEFNLGDELLYIGNVNGLQSGILDKPISNETFTYQFSTNTSCPNTPTVLYESQVYNTIQIFSQCWLKENLNVGVMIPGSQEMTNNGVIEKYCFDNDLANCDIYGGLYQWNEMMQYTIIQGVQGICPPGWHIPTDDEWKILEGMVDSMYPVGDPIWNEINVRGYDVSTRLRSEYGWANFGNGTNDYGFTALPGGYRGYDATFYDKETTTYIWSSTEDIDHTDYSWNRFMGGGTPWTSRDAPLKGDGLSVRCLKN